jgi:hypothetical protein
MEVTCQPHAHAALPPGEGLSVLPVERGCVYCRKKKPLARKRIIISDIPTHIPVNILAMISEPPYTTRLVLKLAAEEVQSR